MDADENRLQDRVTSEGALASWLDADRRGRLILEDDLTLRWCNAAARHMLTNGGRLVLRNGTVRPREPARAQQFSQFIQSSDARLSVYCLTDQEDHHLVLAARRLPGAALIGLTAYDADETFEYHWADLSQAFGLTGAEREIAQALGGGLTAEGIASRFRVSVKTVRTHIRHVYSKLEVSSREELFHKLAPYMLTE